MRNVIIKRRIHCLTDFYPKFVARTYVTAIRSTREDEGWSIRLYNFKTEFVAHEGMLSSSVLHMKAIMASFYNLDWRNLVIADAGLLYSLESTNRENHKK